MRINRHLRQAVYDRDNHRCRICGDDYKLVPHHLVPRRKGGKDTKENIITVCELCHLTIHPWLRYLRSTKWAKMTEDSIGTVLKRVPV